MAENLAGHRVFTWSWPTCPFTLMRNAREQEHHDTSSAWESESGTSMEEEEDAERESDLAARNELDEQLQDNSLTNNSAAVTVLDAYWSAPGPAEMGPDHFTIINIPDDSDEDIFS